MIGIITIKEANRTAKPGSFLVEKVATFMQSRRFRHLLPMVALSFILVGSCHQSTTGSQVYLEDAKPLAELSKGEMMRYAYALQSRLAEDPDYFKNVDEKELTLVLAKPDLLRKDGKSQSWQYATAECVLDVFMTEGRPDIVHYEFRARDASASDPQGGYCLQQLYQTRRAAIDAAFEDVYASTRAQPTEIAAIAPAAG